MKILVALAGALIAVAPAYGVTVVYTTSLSGPAENPTNASPGTGAATITVNTTAHTLRVQATFSGLLGTTTASHIHCCNAAPGVAGVATQTPTFALFPLGVTSGSFDQTLNTLDLASYNPAFVSLNGGTASSAESALFAGLDAGTSYLNIHTSVFSTGEIRGFITAVPEPETFALLLAGVGLMGIAVRRSKPLSGRD